MSGAIRKRSVQIEGHATSVSLEEAFWSALSEIAASRGMSVNKLVAEIDRNRAPDTANLSSAIRVYILMEMQARRGDPAVTPPEARISSVGL